MLRDAQLVRGQLPLMAIAGTPAKTGIPSANLLLKAGEVDRVMRLMSSIFTDLWHYWLQERVEAVGFIFS